MVWLVRNLINPDNFLINLFKFSLTGDIKPGAYFTNPEKKVWRLLASTKYRPDWLSLPGPSGWWEDVDPCSEGFYVLDDVLGLDVAWRLIWAAELPGNFSLDWFDLEGSELRCLYHGSLS